MINTVVVVDVDFDDFEDEFGVVVDDVIVDLSLFFFFADRALSLAEALDDRVFSLVETLLTPEAPPPIAANMTPPMERSGICRSQNKSVGGDGKDESDEGIWRETV